MTYKRIYNHLFGFAALLLGAAIFTGCSNDEKEEGQDDNSFFKISVTTEDFSSNSLTRFAAETKPDTIITPIDGDLYFETVVDYDNSEPEMTRATTRANVDQGQEVIVLAYEGNTYKGRIEGTVKENGSVSMPDNQLYLEPGTYNFICLANVGIEESNNPTYFHILNGQNSMSSDVVTKTINTGDQDCKLSFTLKHWMGQIKVAVNSGKEEFTDLSAVLTTGTGEYPEKRKVTLPDNVYTDDVTMGTLDDRLFTATGTSIGSLYKCYIPNDGENYPPFALKFTKGSVYGNDVTGRTINFTNLTLHKNDRININVTLKKATYTVTFTTQTGGWLSNPGTIVMTMPGTAECTARSEQGYKFEGWYKNTESIPYSTDETITVPVDNDNNGNEFTARFLRNDESDLINLDSWEDAPILISTDADIRKFIGTPDNVFYEINGPEWKTVYDHGHDGFWLLKPEYWTGPEMDQRYYVALGRPHDIDKYDYLPATRWTTNGGSYSGYPGTVGIWTKTADWSGAYNWMTIYGPGTTPYETNGLIQFRLNGYGGVAASMHGW